MSTAREVYSDLNRRATLSRARAHTGNQGDAVKAFRATGFDSSHEFLAMLRASTNSRGELDVAGGWAKAYTNALVDAGVCKSILGNNEAYDSEFGALMGPPALAEKVWLSAQMPEGRTPFGMVERRLTTTNKFIWPAVNETSQVTGSRWGGLTAQRHSEGDQYTSSKPGLRYIQSRLIKYSVFIYATEELVEDGGEFLADSLAELAGRELAYLISDDILNSGGNGTIEGILKSPARITVSKGSTSSGQIATQNVLDMIERIPAESRNSFVWLYTPTAEDVLCNLTTPATTAVGVPPLLRFAEPGQTDDVAFTIAARPAISVPWLPAVGTEGDLVAWDPAEYGLALRSSKAVAQPSIHLKFDTGESAFKFYLRVNGQPLWSQPRTPQYTTTTVSPIVTLASR
jgi:hypothetical protein